VAFSQIHIVDDFGKIEKSNLYIFSACAFYLADKKILKCKFRMDMSIKNSINWQVSMVFWHEDRS